MTNSYAECDNGESGTVDQTARDEAALAQSTADSAVGGVATLIEIIPSTVVSIGGTENAITGSPKPFRNPLSSDEVYDFIAVANNTGPMTLDLGTSEGAVPIKYRGADIQANAIQAGDFVQVVFNGTEFELDNINEVSKPENILPNTNWQLWSGLVAQTLVKEDGSGAQTAVSCTGFATTNNTPTFTTANTGELKVGDLVEITGGGFEWGYSGVAGTPPSTCVRIAGLVPNTSFIARAPLGGVSPSSSFACTATPKMPSNTGALGNGMGADGWMQSTTLAAWPDDFASHAYPGAIRVLGMRKGSAAEESYYSAIPANALRRYGGRTMTFGAVIKQPVQGGAGTWRLGIYDNVNGWRYSAAAESSASYQFLSVTAPIASAATSIQFAMLLSGAIGDTYYAAVPTCVIGDYLSQENCGQNLNETLRAVNHWNPPLLTPLAITISAAYSLGAGLYGFLGQDLEAMSFGACHKSVNAVKAKIELDTATVGAHLLTSTGKNTMTTTTFGPQTVTQVANVVNVGQGILPLSTDGTFSLFTNVSGLVITNATFDFDTVVLASTEIDWD